MMKTHISNLVCLEEIPFASNKFEEVIYETKLLYSFRNLRHFGDIPQEEIVEALQKSIHVCFLAGIDISHHFKQIYIDDPTIGTLQIDWLISKNGFNLMCMQIPSMNKKMASWLWELADF